MTFWEFRINFGQEIQELLKDVRTHDYDGATLKGVKVYPAGRLPIVDDGEDARAISALFPYALVRISSATREEVTGPWILTLDVLLGVCETDPDNAGDDYILLMQQILLDHWSRYPVVGRFGQLKAPIEMALQDDDNYPFFFGGIRLSIYVPALEREVVR